MNNLSAASQLSFFAFTFIVVLLGIELSARKNQKFNNPHASSFEKKIEEISYNKNLLLFFICLLPILFGFINIIPANILAIPQRWIGKDAETDQRPKSFR